MKQQLESQLFYIYIISNTQSRTLKDRKEKNAYTILHRFIFNLKRILQRVGLGSKIGTFGVALAMLIKEGKFNNESKYLLEDKLLEYLKKKKLFNYDDIPNSNIHLVYYSMVFRFFLFFSF